MEFNVANGKDPVSTLNFTKDQRKAYDGLISFINSPWDKDNYKRALVGPAGTGKTYLVKALIKNCNLSYSKIGLAAPTHKAVRVLSESINLSTVTVNTLGSDLGLRLNFNVEKFDIANPPFDPRGRMKIGDYELYIVDEASMINRDLKTLLERSCISTKCKIIYIGDEYQLPPVKEKYPSAFKGVLTFRLKEIVRQDEDNPVRYLLDLLRYDIKHKTFTFLEHISKVREKFDENNIKGYRVCTSEEFNNVVYNNFNDEQLVKNVDFCKVVAYTNPTVSSWNKIIRYGIIEDSETSVITKNDLIISYVTIVNAFNEPIIKNSEDYIIYDIVNYTHTKYDLKGFMVKFQAIHGGYITNPIFVLNHKDNYSIQKYNAISEQLLNDAKTANSKVKPEKWREYFEFKESCLLLTNIIRPDGTTVYSRDIDYGFALTSHKSQGSTFDTVLVDVNDIVYNRYGRPYADAEQTNRRLYVACSRCKNKLYLRYGR